MMLCTVASPADDGLAVIQRATIERGRKLVSARKGMRHPEPLKGVVGNRAASIL
jgi:hypothetical protein